ncbi:MAG: hypothetical protein JKY30_12970 [Flavobacteriales bacterium]|nr:hypothetical protein [Flavobacteriales bacterium]
MGKVIGIATRIKTKASMEVCTTANVSFEKGIGNDSRGVIKGDRQVTVMTQECWDIACTELSQKMRWTTRRANILIEGIDLENTKGCLLKVGNFMLEITGELKPCPRMDEQIVGLTKTLIPNWRGGVTCKIIKEGTVNEGDKVTIERVK